MSAPRKLPILTPRQLEYLDEQCERVRRAIVAQPYDGQRYNNAYTSLAATVFALLGRDSDGVPIERKEVRE